LSRLDSLRGLEVRRVKKHPGYLFLLFSTGLFLVAGFSSLGNPSATSASIAVPPAPNPVPAIPRPQLLPRVAETARLSALDIQRITPVVEVWRPNGQTPQIPARRRNNVLTAFVADSQPLMIRLQFDPAARGVAVLVRTGQGVVLDSATEGLHINANGDCLLTVHLPDDVNQGHLAVRCGASTTMVRLMRSSRGKVLARENSREGGLP
jgi:hypothetical protein